MGTTFGLFGQQRDAEHALLLGKWGVEILLAMVDSDRIPGPPTDRITLSTVNWDAVEPVEYRNDVLSWLAMVQWATIHKCDADSEPWLDDRTLEPRPGVVVWYLTRYWGDDAPEVGAQPWPRRDGPHETDEGGDMSVPRKVPSPSEILAQGPEIPDKMLGVVNQLIRERFFSSTDSIRILRDEIVDRYVAAVHEETPNRDGAEIRAEVFQKHWLDFEPIYKANGWAVQYVTPEWGAIGDSAYIFRAAAAQR